MASLRLCCFLAVLVASSSSVCGLGMGCFQSSVPRPERPLNGTYLARDLSDLRAIISKLDIPRQYELRPCFLELLAAQHHCTALPVNAQLSVPRWLT